MKKNFYLSSAEWFSRRPKLLKFCAATEKGMERAIYLVYPVFLAWLFFNGKDFWWKSAVVCFLSLCLVSFIRSKLNAKRPYEKFGFDPLIKREKGGRGFPSRHAFSGAIISLHIGIVFPPVGIITGVMTLLIATLRAFFGIHFIKDLVCGILCGIAFGLLVFLF